jgi:hypothetical protein
MLKDDAKASAKSMKHSSEFDLQTSMGKVNSHVIENRALNFLFQKKKITNDRV